MNTKIFFIAFPFFRSVQACDCRDLFYLTVWGKMKIFTRANALEKEIVPMVGWCHRESAERKNNVALRFVELSNNSPAPNPSAWGGARYEKEKWKGKRHPNFHTFWMGNHFERNKNFFRPLTRLLFLFDQFTRFVRTNWNWKENKTKLNCIMMTKFLAGVWDDSPRSVNLDRSECSGWAM